MNKGNIEIKGTGKTWVLGDIHGAAKAVQQCFDRSNFDFEKDILIQLGDVCDGWSEVSESVDLLLKCKNACFLRGNHDSWFREWLTFGIHPTRWMHGGYTTAESYIRHAATKENPINLIPSAGAWITNLTNIDIPESHKEFFDGQTNYYVDEKNRLFIHGGFDRGLPLREQDPEEFLWNRRLWKQAMSCTGGNKLVTVEGFSEIFIGHTATTNWKNGNTPTDSPMSRGGVWNVDTGAGFNGKLTIMNIETKEYFQSDPVLDLYPGEYGRNG